MKRGVNFKQHYRCGIFYVPFDIRLVVIVLLVLLLKGSKSVDCVHFFLYDAIPGF